MGLDPHSPPSTCVHLSLTPFPPPCGRHKWMAPYCSLLMNDCYGVCDQQHKRPSAYVNDAYCIFPLFPKNYNCLPYFPRNYKFPPLFSFNLCFWLNLQFYWLYTHWTPLITN